MQTCINYDARITEWDGTIEEVIAIKRGNQITIHYFNPAATHVVSEEHWKNELKPEILGESFKRNVITSAREEVNGNGYDIYVRGRFSMGEVRLTSYRWFPHMKTYDLKQLIGMPYSKAYKTASGFYVDETIKRQ